MLLFPAVSVFKASDDVVGFRPEVSVEAMSETCQLDFIHGSACLEMLRRNIDYGISIHLEMNVKLREENLCAGVNVYSVEIDRRRLKPLR